MGLIDLFIKPEPEEKKNNNEGKKGQSASKPQSQQTAPKTETPEPTPLPYTIDSTTEVSIDVQQRLWKTLQDRNIPGPDMMELVTYSTSMESSGLPVEKRYELAFNVLKSQYPNFNKKTLLNSVDVYISYVKEELESGKRQFQEKRRREVELKNTEIQTMNANCNKLMAQIEELKKKQAELSEQIKKSQEAVSNADKNIAHNQQVFENTINALIAKLQADKEVMSNLNI